MPASLLLTWDTWTKLFFFVSVAFSALAAALFLFLPMHSVQVLLGPLGSSVADRWESLAAAPLFISAAAYCYFKAFSVTASPTSPRTQLEIRETPGKRTLTFWALLLVFVFVRGVYEIGTTSLDWDEHLHTVWLKLGQDPNAMNPLHFTQHTLSTIPTWFAIKLPWPMYLTTRFPAVLFSALFLLLIYRFCRQCFSPILGTFLITALATNQTIRWYLHSQRGYLALLIVTTAGMWCLVRWEEGALDSAKAFRAMVGLYALSLITHLFATLHFLAFFLALAIWLACRGGSCTAERLAGARRILLIPILFLPVFAAIAIGGYLSLRSYGHVMRAAPLDLYSALQMYIDVLSVNRAYWVRLLILLMAALWFEQGSSKTGFGKKLVHWFFPVSFLFLFLAFAMMKSDIYPRLMIGLTVPTLLLIGSQIELLRSPWKRRIAWTAAFLTLVLPSGFEGNGEASFTNGMDSYVSFMKEVRHLVPDAPACYSFSETGYFYSMTALYLPHRQAEPCRPKYHLHLAISVLKEPQLSLANRPPPKEAAQWKLLLSRADQFQLYEIP